MDEIDGCLVYLLTLACIVMVLFALALFISWDGMGRDGIELGVKVKGGKWLKEKKSTYIINKTSTHASRRLGRWVCRQRVTGC